MKAIILVFVAYITVTYAQEDAKFCVWGTVDKFTDPVCFSANCRDEMQKHIKVELDASLTYLYLAAYFDQANVARPGLAKFLYGAAEEERQHAILMLDYFNKRGFSNLGSNFAFAHDISDVEEFLKAPSYLGALELATKKEVEVTNKIHDIIKECSASTNSEDFHAADVYTDPILDEQHESIRVLQGAIKTLLNMNDITNSAQVTSSRDISKFSEYLMDKKFLAM